MIGPTLDVEALYTAIDRQRRSRHMQFRTVAQEAGVSPSTLTRIGHGRRPDADGLVRLLAWLGTTDLAGFVQHAEQDGGSATMDEEKAVRYWGMVADRYFDEADAAARHAAWYGLIKHASPSCACGVNDAGQRFTDPICRGQWEPAEQAKPTCTCPMIDVTNVRARIAGVAEFVQGLDPGCLACRKPTAEQDGDGR